MSEPAGEEPVHPEERPEQLEPGQPMPMRDKIVLRILTKAFMPFILLFALYVQFHGDFGPGGGFQAGVIFAAGFILFGLMFGLDTVQQVAPPRIVEYFIAVGVLIFGGVGLAAMVLGGHFLDYDRLDLDDPKHGQHLGILLIESGVGITVAATMLMIFYAFAGRGAPDPAAPRESRPEEPLPGEEGP